MLDYLSEKYKDLPWMTPEQACVFQQVISKYNIKSVLELGHARGKSSVLIASILKNTNGHLTTLNQLKDEDVYPDWNNKIFELLKEENLEEFVTVIKSQRSWYPDLLELCNQKQKFDLIYIDGDHTINGIAADFLFAEKLLNKNGLVIFDDIYWSLQISPGYNYFQDLSVMGNTYTMMNDSELHTQPVKLFCESMLTEYREILCKHNLAVYQKIDK